MFTGGNVDKPNFEEIAKELRKENLHLFAENLQLKKDLEEAIKLIKSMER